ncbi:oxidoreductase [Leucobacter sp. Psy1]|uniref:SDR family NAD(P)-dependent oxidoreductase n=1 Tax=Leucobacter sp. Psy1 TaxID=2875729 RepID=UPI001CD2B660|nr:SDR family oxidoreductase [Leucobacter sp. Psy1]UBH04504.1 oxidoreductase [Leucobacter sp. Psy1]
MTDSAAAPIDLTGRRVVIAGATSAAGDAATRTLLAAGAEVIVTGRDTAKLAPLASLGARTEVVDLTSEGAVDELADRVLSEGPIDGLLHLVGGWRGGGGLAGQTEADYRALETSLTALRYATRAFDAALRASPGARVAMISSTAVARPLAGGANYAAVKAASEAWMRAVAHGFAKAARDSESPLRAAATVFRVKALAGLEQRVADAYLALWSEDASAVNDTMLEIAPRES